MDIQKQIRLKTPRSKVWRALSTPSEFRKWFEADVQGEFAPGARAHLTTTNEAYKGIKFHIDIERVEPEHTLTWRWGHLETPPDVTTLVEFHLEEVDGGTLVTVTESGLDGIALEYRSKIFEENSKGWDIQLQNIGRYVGQSNQ
jgi:uncharacterized protein YndB with AHSA1/START domain